MTWIAKSPVIVAETFELADSDPLLALVAALVPMLEERTRKPGRRSRSKTEASTVRYEISVGGVLLTLETTIPPPPQPERT